MRAKYIMSRSVITSRPEMSVSEAKELMRAHHVSGLPVINDNGVVVGVFSQTDALEKDGCYVKDLMTSPAVTVDEEAAVNEVAALMAAKNINRVPVLSQGRLVGVVSRADLVRFVATHHAWTDYQARESCRLDLLDH